MRKWWIALLAPAALLISLGANHRPPSSLRSTPALRTGLSRSDRVTVDINQTNLPKALVMYSELTGRTQLPRTSSIWHQMDEFFWGYLSRWHILKRPPQIRSDLEYHRDGLFTAGEVKEHLEKLFAANGLVLVSDGSKHFRAIPSSKR